MTDEAYNMVARARESLERGAKRDDVYHEVVRFAAMNGADRYALWLKVVQ